MLKQGLINRDLLAYAAELGHTDSFVIADCGLLIPEHVPVVDVSVEFGYPEFFDVTGRLLPHIVAESVVVAKEAPAAFAEELALYVADAQQEVVSHEELKRLVADAKFVVRTGSVVPYSNVVVRCGVPF